MVLVGTAVIVWDNIQSVVVRWTLTRRKWAWGVSSQLLTSHHLTQTHSCQLGKHSISPRTQVSATLSCKIWLKPQQTLNICQESTQIHLKCIFLSTVVCWVCFSASSHSLTRQSKTLSNHNVFSFLPRSDFVSCAMSRQPLSDSPITSNILLYTALCCVQFCFYK